MTGCRTPLTGYIYMPNTRKDVYQLLSLPVLVETDCSWIDLMRQNKVLSVNYAAYLLLSFKKVANSSTNG